jgi:hypothetical protein
MNVQIVTQIDASDVREHLNHKDASRTRMFSFWIRWEFDGVPYPEPVWYDFGSVLLRLWIDSTIRLMEGSTKEEFQFMEGSYALTAERQGAEVALRDNVRTRGWVVSIEDLRSQLLIASNKVTEDLERFGLCDRYFQSLKDANSRLAALRIRE